MERKKILVSASKARGYLSKKSSNVLVGWQKRFWLIVDDYLCYYRDETLAEQKGQFQIKKLLDIQPIEKTELRFTFQGRLFELKATNSAQRDEWYKSLKILKQYERTNSPKKDKVKRKSTLVTSPRAINSNRRSMIQSFERLTQEEQLENTLRLIGLPRCADQVSERRISERVAVCFCKQGYYFFISAKPVGMAYEDEQILSEQYVKPLKMNVLYNNRIGKQISTQIISCSKIYDIQIQDDSTIRINYGNLLELKCSNGGLQLFASRLKRSILIAKQYYNQFGIQLKRNIQPCVKIYDQLKGLIQRRKKVKQYFQSNYQQLVNTKIQIKNYQQFQNFQKHLMDMLKVFVEACQVKIIPRVDLAQEYTQFMHEKIYNNFKNFWNKEYLKLKDQELLKLYAIVEMHNKTLQKYLKDDRVKEGMNILASIYFRKTQIRILKKIEVELQKDESWQIQIGEQGNSTKIWNKIEVIFDQQIRNIFQVSQSNQIKNQLNMFLCFIYETLCGKLKLIMEKQNDYKIIIALIDQLNKIQQGFKNIIINNKLESTDINLPLIRIHSTNKLFKQFLIKRLFEVLFANISKGVLTNSFMDLEMQNLCNEIIQKITIIKSARLDIMKQIQNQSLVQIIQFYTNLFNIKKLKQHTQTGISIDSVIQKINKDKSILENKYNIILQNNHLKTINILIRIIQFLQADNIFSLRKHCITLKHQYSNLFNINIALGLISLKNHLSIQLLQQMNKISNQILQRKDSIAKSQMLQPIKRQFYMQQNRIRRSTLSVAIGSPLLAKPKMEGYLQKKKIDDKVARKLKLFYEQRYFRLIDGQLVWYLNPSIKQVQNKINLAQVRKVYKHNEKQNVFVVQMIDCKYKFKASSPQQCRKWFSCIVKSIDKKEQKKVKKLQQGQKQMIKDFFNDQESYKTKYNTFQQKQAYNQSLRPSVLSMLTQKRLPQVNKNSNQDEIYQLATNSNRTMNIKNFNKQKKQKGCWWMIFNSCIIEQ